MSALHLRLQAAEATGDRTHALLFESEQMVSRGVATIVTESETQRNIVYLTIYRFIEEFKANV